MGNQTSAQQLAELSHSQRAAVNSAVQFRDLARQELKSRLQCEDELHRLQGSNSASTVQLRIAEHERKRKQYNEEAAQLIFQAYNPPGAPPTELNLTSLTFDESLPRVQNRIDDCITFGLHSLRISTGLQSTTDIATLTSLALPAVSHLRSRYGLHVMDDNPVLGMMTIMLPRISDRDEDENTLVEVDHEVEEEANESWSDTAWRVGMGVGAALVAGFALYKSVNPAGRDKRRGN